MPELQPACPTGCWVQSTLKGSFSPSFLAMKAYSVGCQWGDGQSGSSPVSEPTADKAVSPVNSCSCMAAE